MAQDDKLWDSEDQDPADEMFELTQGENLGDEISQVKPIGYFRDSMRRFVKNKPSIVSFVIIIIIIFLAIAGPMFNEYGFNQQQVDRTFMPPRIPFLKSFGFANGTRVLMNRRTDTLDDAESFPPGSVLGVKNLRTVRGVEVGDIVVDYYKLVGAEDEYYWIGTDYLGRDLWTRLCRGTRISLIIALFSVIANIFIGVVYGALAGYYGGALDMILMRISEIIDAMPQIVVVIMFILLFKTGFLSISLSLVIKGWIPTARMIRSQFYRFKNREYVIAARTLGVPDMVLIVRHILPNSIGPIITRAMIAIPAAIFTESFLAYIGLGVQAPEPSIGVLLSRGQRTLLDHPYQTFYPALMISVLVVAFNLFSNGLRFALDPTNRGDDE